MSPTLPLDSEGSAREEIAKRLEFLTERELAQLAGVKESTLAAWRKRGRGPNYVRFGAAALYPLEAVRAFLNGKTTSRRPGAGLI